MDHVGQAPGPPPSGPTRIYTDFFLLQLAALVFLCDQFTKFLVTTFLRFGASFPEAGFFRITHTINTGSAFGLFQGHNSPLILVALLGISVLVLVYYSQRQRTNLLRFSLGLQIGGAFGNLIDRVRLGHVTDFLDVGPWPVFNVADSSIVVGLVLLGWIFLGPASRAGHRQVEETGTSAAVSAGPPFSMADSCPICGGELRSVVHGRQCASCGIALLPQNGGAFGPARVAPGREDEE